jgi:hypothetical protein
MLDLDLHQLVDAAERGLLEEPVPHAQADPRELALPGQRLECPKSIRRLSFRVVTIDTTEEGTLTQRLPHSQVGAQFLYRETNPTPIHRSHAVAPVLAILYERGRHIPNLTERLCQQSNPPVMHDDVVERASVLVEDAS